MFFPWCLMLRSIVYALIYLPSCRLTTNTPLLRNPREPRENDTVVVFLLSPRGRELFNFGNHYAGPQGHTHRICLIFGPRYIALDQSFFCSILLHFDAKFWYHVVGVHTFPLGKNYLSLILCPLSRAFEQFLLVTKKQFPGDVPGLTHKEAYDTGKCITAEFKNIKMGPLQVRWGKEIGRASCRERV